MATLISRPTTIQAAGQPPKLIEEFIGRVNSKTAAVSVARMKSPSGWAEPGQTPEFDEYTAVFRGCLHVRLKGEEFDVKAGQAVIVPAGEWVQYSTPSAEGAEYMAICIPAFSPAMVHRDKMMPSLTLRLNRLELIAATKELLQAEKNLEELGRGLQAEVPDNWPPPLYDNNARQFFLTVVSADAEAVGWTTWYILLPNASGKKTLIGGVGACGLPDEDGKIVIGYSLLDQFHGNGYATEALRGFLDWASQNPRLRTVVADTFPHLTKSIRVLEKNGFVRCGAGADEGSIRFELPVR